MERKAYNEKLVKNITRMGIDMAHPEWTNEQKEAELGNPECIAKTVRNLTIIDLKNKLFEEHDGTHTMRECADEAEYLINNIPPELMVNVNEYLDNKPLSDIKVHGVSINDVFEMFKRNRPIHFIHILHCMAKWHSLDYFNEDFCWNYFARM